MTVATGDKLNEATTGASLNAEATVPSFVLFLGIKQKTRNVLFLLDTFVQLKYWGQNSKTNSYISKHALELS